MNTVHAARGTAPSFKIRIAHPVDRICEAQHHIKGLGVVINYACRQNDEHGDGPEQSHFSACLDAITALAEQISEALDDLCLNYDVTPSTCRRPHHD